MGPNTWGESWAKHCVSGAVVVCTCPGRLFLFTSFSLRMCMHVGRSVGHWRGNHSVTVQLMVHSASSAVHRALLYVCVCIRYIVMHMLVILLVCKGQIHCISIGD